MYIIYLKQPYSTAAHLQDSLSDPPKKKIPPKVKQEVADATPATESKTSPRNNNDAKVSENTSSPRAVTSPVDAASGPAMALGSSLDESGFELSGDEVFAD